MPSKDIPEDKGNARKMPYIKPTRYMHDSGYRCFEVGYWYDDDNVEVLGQGPDHIFTDYMVLVGEAKPFSVNIDLTKKGYIRFFSHQGALRWDNEELTTSSMGIILKPKKQEQGTDLVATDKEPK